MGLPPKPSSKLLALSATLEKYPGRALVFTEFLIKGVDYIVAHLLIDDIVDSRWTLTEVAALLRQNGSGPVHPMLLAEATSD